MVALDSKRKIPNVGGGPAVVIGKENIEGRCGGHEECCR